VRELRHVVECAIALAGTAMLGVEDVEPLLGPAENFPVAARPAGHGSHELLQVLDEAGWDVDLAARRLGVHRATIYRRLKRVSPKIRPAAIPSLPTSPDVARLQLEA
jgi:transcriptional regulator of acetoin/glycerol metabolism